MYANPNLTPEQIAEVYKNAATRPADESGTPRASDGLPCTRAASECSTLRIEVKQYKSEAEKFKELNDRMVEQINDLTAKLLVAGGATERVRNDELMRKVQSIHIGYQNNVENLEAECQYLRKQVRFLENIISKDCDVIYDSDEWTAFEAPVKDAKRMADEWAALTGGDGSQL